MCVCGRGTPSLYPPWLSEKELKLLRQILSIKCSQSYSGTTLPWWEPQGDWEADGWNKAGR